MIIVLDSSAAVELILGRGKAKALREIVAVSERVLSTALYKVEMVGMIRRYYEGKYIDRGTCGRMLELAERLVDEIAGVPEDNAEILNEAIRLKCPVNDVLYLSLARRSKASLVTVDRRLRGLAAKEGITVLE